MSSEQTTIRKRMENCSASQIAAWIEEQIEGATARGLVTKGINTTPAIFELIATTGHPSGGGKFRDIPLAVPTNLDFDMIEIVFEEKR